jgi:hypothetical protein
MICQGFKPDSGNLTVRHYRGASRNVRHGEIVNPPVIERAGAETLTYSEARSISIPTTGENFGTHKPVHETAADSFCPLDKKRDRGPAVCSFSDNKEGKDEMIKASIDLQDLRS